MAFTVSACARGRIRGQGAKVDKKALPESLGNTSLDASLYSLPKPRSIAEERSTRIVPSPDPARRSELASIAGRGHEGPQAWEAN